MNKKKRDYDVVKALNLGSDENLDWLELDEIPKTLDNPFFDIDLLNSQDILDPIEKIVYVSMTTKYLHFACKHILGITLMPFQMVALEMMWTKKMPLVVCSRGFSKCIVGDSLIRTNSGLLRIDEIISKDSIEMNKIPLDIKTQGENSFKDVEYGWNNGLTKTIKINTSYGYELEGTYNHPIRVVSDTDIIWKNMEDLTTDDYTIIDRSHYDFGNNGLDKDTAWWIGATIGDGMVCRKNKITFTNIDKELIDNWSKVAEKLSGKQVKKDGKYGYTIYGIPFSKYVNEIMGLQYKKSHFKFVPDIIRKAPKESVAAFLSGMFDTDGYCAKGVLGLSTTSLEMSKQIQTMLLCFGINSKRGEKYTNCKGKIFKSYLVSIYNSRNFNLFKKYIGFRCKRKQEKLDIVCKKSYNPNNDIIPDSMIVEKLDRLVKLYRNNNKKGGKNRRYINKYLSPSRRKYYGITYLLLEKVLEITKNESGSNEWKNVKLMLDQNYIYQKIDKIEYSEAQTYDIHIPEDHSFISNGFISHNSFLLAVYALLRMIFHPGCKIIVVGSAFRQSKIVFDYMVDIWDKAPVLRDIAGKGKMGGKRDVDRCEFNIGSSRLYALPIGTGDKIRGLRANYILCDEIAAISEEILNVVIRGFAIVSSNPIEKAKEAATVKRLKSAGLWTQETEDLYREKIGGNQIILSGTASFEFNHFYKTFRTYRQIILSRGDKGKLKEIMHGSDSDVENINWKDYAIMRVPYTYLPEGFLDSSVVAQGRANMNSDQFFREFCGIFAVDSDGFYKRSVIEAATTNRAIQIGNEDIQFSAKRIGDAGKVHVMAIDPAADSDNAAIVIGELNPSHRKVIHCWTTNRKKYVKYKHLMLSQGIEIQDDYYRYIAKKIRSLMREFNIEHIIMDKNGGGIAIAEALSSFDTCKDGEYPIYLTINREDPQPDDIKQGIHILELLVPTTDINSEANHGMLKDLQDKVLLFPMFDTIEMAKALEMDKINEIKYDTYEKLVEEIEELKNEMTTIVCTPSANLGKEMFNTPDIKQPGQKKGRLRKDRYSALLYMNYYARNKGKNEPIKIEYKSVGATRDSARITFDPRQPLYHGPGVFKLKNGMTDYGNYNGGRIVQKGGN